jgi:serine/threonine protein kinase
VPNPSEDPREPGEETAEAGQTAPRKDAPTENLAGPPTAPAGVDPTAGLTQDRAESQPDDLGEETGSSDGPGGATTPFTNDPPSDPPVGTKIRYLGDYELLDLIGKGGMGVVYRARQISLNRVVALKLIRLEGAPSDAELLRFQDEAEAIASLDHPGVVPIYEVGTHEGRHYFSMKLISGQSLQKAIPSLRRDFRTIGKILAGAARAVQHAHERGILHRDIKPANILLDSENAAHVGDFGLAKRMDAGNHELTMTGTVVGTPAYMAPEQATATRGTITIATDVYGLGAVLYALLSGHAPHRGSSMLEILDAVREHNPESPSKGDATIPRDLDVICMKCLEKEPGRRYHSARELADDLDRWLDGRPITARPVGPATRAVMWCRRKPLAAGLAAAFLISAIVGSTGILINWREVRRQRDELAKANVQVRSEWQASRSLNEFLVSDLLAWSSPFLAARRDVPVSSLLDRSSAAASARFVNRPKLEGSIRQALGHSYLALGMLPKAEAELLHSAKLREALPEGDELDRLSSEYVLARLRLDQGKIDEAEVRATKALEGRRRLLGEADEATLEAAELLGAVLKMKGRVVEAKALLEKTAAAAREALGDEHQATLHALTDLAVIAHDQGRLNEAYQSFDQLTRTSTRVFGVDHPETLFARSRLGVVAFSLGQLEPAEKILEAVVEPARDVLGPEHPETLRIVANLAAIRVELGKNEAAAKGMEEARKGQRAALPLDHIDGLKNEINGVVGLLKQGKAVEAEPLLRDLISRMRAQLRSDDPLLGQALSTTANALQELNKTVEAETLIDESIEILGKTLPREDRRIVNAEATRAALCLANGKFAEAEKAAVVVVALRSRPGAVDSPWRLGAIKSVLGGALAAQKKFTDAEPLLLEAFQMLEADPRAPKRRVSESLQRVIQLYEASGKPDEAAKWRARPLSRPGT